MRHLVFFFLIVSIFYSCSNQNKGLENDSNICELFLSKNVIDTIIFTNLPNNCKKSSIEDNPVIKEANKQLSIDSSFDRISDGFLFKYFLLSPNNTFLSIIKSPYNKYYYWDNYELYKNDSILEFYNPDSSFVLISKKFDTIPIFNETNDRECKLLFYFFNDVFSYYGNKKSSTEKIEIIHRLLNKLYVNAQFTCNGGFYCSIDDYIKEVDRFYLLDNIIPTNSKLEEKDASKRTSKIFKLLNKSDITHDELKRVSNFEIIGVGIFIFEIEILNNKVALKKYFIPAIRRKLVPKF